MSAATFRSRRRLACLLALAMLLVAAPAAARTHSDSERITVRFHDGVPAADAARLQASVQARPVRSIEPIGVTVLEVPAGAAAQAAAALERSPAVEYAEVDGAGELDATPNDRYWSNQWGLVKVEGPAAWDIQRGTPSTIIAVLDTGVDAGHEDLKGGLVAGRDIVHNDANPADDHGHGTRTAGVAAARTDNRQGIAGACWGCVIMPVKVARADGSVAWSDVADGLVWAADNGADVISMSLSGSKKDRTLELAVQYAYAKGALLVASAGNTGGTGIRYPAGYSEVIAVAGTTSSDTLYGWSTHGSWVDVAAPGCNWSLRMGGGYGDFCGTSSATPLVAGLAGLAVSQAPGAGNATISSAITSTAVSIGNVVRHGRVNAHAMLLALAGTGSPGPEPAPSEPTEPEPDPGDDSSVTTQSDLKSFKGTLTSKNSVRTHEVEIDAGTLSLALSFNRASQLRLRLLDSSGTVLGDWQGASVLEVTAPVKAGTHFVEISGEPASYTVSGSVASTS
jgi:thermitase